MEPLQARALDALQPFVALSKSATSARAAADLVIRATSCANTYVFAELLETPNIQSLRTAEAQYAAHLTLLEIFAWGTWQDYKGWLLHLFMCNVVVVPLRYGNSREGGFC